MIFQSLFILIFTPYYHFYKKDCLLKPNVQMFRIFINPCTRYQLRTRHLNIVTTSERCQPGVFAQSGNNSHAILLAFDFSNRIHDTVFIICITAGLGVFNKAILNTFIEINAWRKYPEKHFWNRFVVYTVYNHQTFYIYREENNALLDLKMA